MDKSLSNFELNESVLKSDSDQGSDKNSDHGSEKNSEGTIEELVFNTGSSDSSLEMFDNNLPPTVTLLRHEESGSKVYLVGTAHFSRESQEDVAKVISNVSPDVVVVELCDARTNIISLDEETILREVKDMSLQKIMDSIKANGLYNGVIYCLLLNATAQITKQTGMAPGGEFRTAFKEACKIPHCRVQLGDRPFNITIKRALGTLGWFHYFKLGWHLLTSDTNITPEDIEKCKQRDILEQFLTEMSGEFPALRRVFLDERDIFLTHSLQTAAKSKVRSSSPGVRSSTPVYEPVKVVGVVGMGHVPGITRLWPNDQRSYVPDIMTIPPPSLASKAFRVSFRLTVITIGSYLVYRYVPVPKTLIEYVHLGLHKMLLSIKTGTSNVAKFTIH